MELLSNLLIEDTHIQKLVKELESGNDQQLITGLTSSARAVFTEMLYKERQKAILIVTPNLLHAQKLTEDLVKLVGEELVRLYPADELIAADISITSPELRAQRLEALDHMFTKKNGIYIVPIAGLKKYMPNVKDWKESIISVAEGDEIILESFLQSLVDMGYVRQPMVTAPGEFALRGGIIDIYPLYLENPIRIELFDTEVDSIRTFSAEDQRSLEKLKDIRILPATEYVLTADKKKLLAHKLEQSLAESLKKVKLQEMKDQFYQNIQHDIELLKQGEQPKEFMKYVSLLDEDNSFLGNYFNQDGMVLFDELGRVQEVADTLEREENDWFLSLLEEGKTVHDVKPSFHLKDIIHMLPNEKVYFSLFSRTFSGISIKKNVTISCKPMQNFHGQMHLLKNEVERFIQGKFRVVILADGKDRVSKVHTVLEDYEIVSKIGASTNDLQQPGIFVVEGDLDAGFELPLQRIAVITDAELFKQKHKKKTRTQKVSNAERIKSYSEIKPGDNVVHIHHGIGKYIGIETLLVNGIHKDYLHIRYRGEDKLFVPVDQIDLIQKYVASGEKDPKLHKLGGADWKKTKTKVSAAVQDIADELIKLYAKREAEVGYAFEPDGEMQQSFEAAFPYEETEDQLRTISEVKQDMERARPMDRLVCGDVGYGKTEVAIRAAFKAVMEGKQVAFLCPTTILAQQHYETMLERFQEFPIEVGLLSRFRSKKQQTETINGLKKGMVDVVVGTHRILSKDVVYHDLGLLVVDEEQRFGVKHKEKIKQLKTNVDVITLTATPIPRTLHMSMIGVRDLSVIETPPKNRFPVQTYVMEYNGALVREAIERELARGGQAFYLYNRVEDITRKVDEIQMLVPSARVGFAHGQMSETELESVIISFLEGEYDVLVTTTIIETGIDIPNVNTLIIHDADKMGLSQLYQLRGRVGRSNRVAYAYLMHQRDKVLTDVAEKRLQAIKEFTELGSGFKIAMRDLSIRGAGNLLGSQQHGFIDSVGFDLYTQMLEDAIEEKRTGIKKEEIPDLEIVLSTDAYISDEYIPDGYQKIQMYKRVKAMEKEEEYLDLVDELQDRFGDLPLEAEKLLRIARMKVYGKSAGVESIKEVNKTVSIRFSVEGTQNINGALLVEKSMKYGRGVGFTMDNSNLVITIDERKTGKFDPFDVLEEMMLVLPEAKKEIA
ncbi:transcription-repair coupling factor [Psychrobacillus lasiicapitis]|uniref:Transcription-repair-coupling factor n=1 Tax=Psychrobacillus lasiicapitis TaxID=1636719 RepID=A0A544SSU3_9BACI|nr:transcription-repair coupling factor [Psychrobacillus lasiicapitis]TQR08286.1 transcription-repair coupling factor [Psychrobacillus lasiicapitis]GGA48538.1 transcription-repair-coupling factor [Psychrobacillus lasiicapitis]